MKKEYKENESFEGNLYENLFIPKKTPYEDLFTGGVIEELSEDTPYSFVHPNSDEVKDLLQKNRGEK
ncbi:hypothetical protein VN21_09600 [Paraclostridium benzoelyticum]|uniref:Uncharacterized protein n=1 Tax=Paraclostridium benzoelyticum TaxID=1629550 RepID=A0A0M3DIJ5_9FIRM|nr:hypothetical protein [Paraclostridium benzoelyticum]KKY01264.1 hypothetical protein VN21_09600 [Paraclostridium benzoelyticum]